MAKYQLRYECEWFCESMLWGNDQATWAAFDFGPIDPAKLPLSSETAERMRQLCDWHNDSLNWSYPPDPGLWRQDECDRFNAAVIALYQQVVRELGGDFEVINTQPILKEDPDLDEYLRNPKNFRR